MRTRAGFTMLEILITVVIIGILATLAVPGYMSTVEKSKKQEALQVLTILREAQQRYWIGNNAYADNFDGLDFNPNDTLMGQTAIFTYTIGTSGDSQHWTARASRTGQPGAGGNYTMQIDQDGMLASNF